MRAQKGASRKRQHPNIIFTRASIFAAHCRKRTHGGDEVLGSQTLDQDKALHVQAMANVYAEDLDGRCCWRQLLALETW
jgi:hypothetical protein